MDPGAGGRRGVVPGAPTGSTPGEGFQGGGLSAASSVGRSESDSRRGVLLRGVGSGAVPGKSGTTYVGAEPVGKGGGTGAAGEKGSGGGGEGAVGDEGGEERGGGGCGAGCRGIEARSILARLEDLKSWTACCKALASVGALSKRAINRSRLIWPKKYFSIEGGKP